MTRFQSAHKILCAMIASPQPTFHKGVECFSPESYAAVALEFADALYLLATPKAAETPMPAQPEPEVPWYDCTRYAEFWPTVPDNVVAIATDEDGLIAAYSRVPEADCPRPGVWGGGYEQVLRGSLNRGPCADWRESLSVRPGTPA